MINTKYHKNLKKQYLLGFRVAATLILSLLFASCAREIMPAPPDPNNRWLQYHEDGEKYELIFVPRFTNENTGIRKPFVSANDTIRIISDQIGPVSPSIDFRGNIADAGGKRITFENEKVRIVLYYYFPDICNEYNYEVTLKGEVPGGFDLTDLHYEDGGFVSNGMLSTFGCAYGPVKDVPVYLRAYKVGKMPIKTIK